LKADKKSLYAMMLDLASGKLEKEELTGYIKENTIKRKKK
jgi:hypothetical protein